MTMELYQSMDLTLVLAIVFDLTQYPFMIYC